MISELITFRITKAKAKAKKISSGGHQINFTLNWLSCKTIVFQLINLEKRKQKRKSMLGESISL